MLPHSSSWQIQLICQSVRCALVRLNGSKQWLWVFMRAFSHQVVIQLNLERFYPSPILSRSRWKAIEEPCSSTAIHSALLKLFESWRLQPVKRQQSLRILTLSVFAHSLSYIAPLVFSLQSHIGQSLTESEPPSALCIFRSLKGNSICSE